MASPWWGEMGKFDEVVDYCMKDTQLVYDLWQYGQNNGIVKAFSMEKGEHLDLEVKW